MIKYNNRYRGPYEYDKFVLNIMNLYNAVKLCYINELNNNSDFKSLANINNNINSIYNTLMQLEVDVVKEINKCEEEY